MREWLIQQDTAVGVGARSTRRWWNRCSDTAIVAVVDDDCYPGGVEGFLANHKEQGS